MKKKNSIFIRSYHMKYEMKLVLELLNQSANIGIVKLDDTARDTFERH